MRFFCLHLAGVKWQFKVGFLMTPTSVRKSDEKYDLHRCANRKRLTAVLAVDSTTELVCFLLFFIVVYSVVYVMAVERLLEKLYGLLVIL